MTNEAKQVLTDDEINELCWLTIDNTSRRAVNDREMARGIEQAVLARVGAPAQPVARMEWRIQVAGPAGYVRFENFKGETLDDACGDALKQGYICCQDEDGEPVVANPAPAAPQEAVPAGGIVLPTMPPSRGQSHVLFEDGYAEGWAKCLELCAQAIADSRALKGTPAAAVPIPTNQQISDYLQGLDQVTRQLVEREARASAVPAPWWPDVSQRGAMWSGLSSRLPGLTNIYFEEICATIKHVIDSKRPTVDIVPPATSRDRWMYEQGRLAAAVPAAQPVMRVRVRVDHKSGDVLPLEEISTSAWLDALPHGTVLDLYAAPQAGQLSGNSGDVDAADPDRYLQERDYHLLHRFIETTEDDEGYDIGKDSVKRLAELGVIQSHGFGRYSVTEFGYYAHETHWHQKSTLPLMTNNDRDERQRAAIAAMGKGNGNV